jgi:hypothetical protein
MKTVMDTVRVGTAKKAHMHLNIAIQKKQENNNVRAG